MQKNLTTKLAVIGFIALVLIIPLSMISGKISERQNYLNQAKYSVASSWTGSQQIMGPVIVIPYEVEKTIEVWDEGMKEKITKRTKKTKKKYILPELVTINATVANDIRYKGIYKVPVYTALLDVSGELDMRSLQKTIERIRSSGDSVKMGRAYLVTTVSDPRGINSIPTLNWLGKQLSFKPGSRLSANSGGIHAYLPNDFLKLNRKDTKRIAFNFQLELRGMETLSFIPVGQEAVVKISSSWPHPEFIGLFLPASRTIDDSSYQAEWKITSFASNIAEKILQCERGKCKKLFEGEFGVRHIESVDVYLQSGRSVKYGFLFIGLSFITFFIFEIVKKLPIHAIQYTLVGCAIAIFYLLLVSLSEHIHFALAYGIASVCCISLLLYYLRYVLGGYKQAAAFSAMLLLLYGVLYVIISAEDFAFLMGGFLTFATLVVVMISTRNIDWYKVGERAGTEESDAGQAKGVDFESAEKV